MMWRTDRGSECQWSDGEGCDDKVLFYTKAGRLRGVQLLLCRACMFAERFVDSWSWRRSSSSECPRVQDEPRLRPDLSSGNT